MALAFCNAYLQHADERFRKSIQLFENRFKKCTERKVQKTYRKFELVEDR